MPEQFTDGGRECYEFAAEARAKADATNQLATNGRGRCQTS